MIPTVSVIIPSYNHAQYIERAVQSVLQQTLEELEVIVIDDGSADDSLARLGTIADKRLRVIAQDNQGAHNTLNRGLKLASGRFLAILNSDDEYAPDRLMSATRLLEARADIGFVSSWIEIVDAYGNVLDTKRGWENLQPWPSRQPELTFAVVDDFARNLLQSNFVSTTSNLVMRRELFQAVGDFRNLRFAHDWDFCLRASSSHNGLLIPRALLRYRVHGSNTIRQDPTVMAFEICWVLAANLPLFSRRILHDATSEQTLDFAVRLYHSLHTFENDRLFIVMQLLQGALDPKGDPIPLLDLLDIHNPIRAWCLDTIRTAAPHRKEQKSPGGALRKIAERFSKQSLQ